MKKAAPDTDTING